MKLINKSALIAVGIVVSLLVGVMIGKRIDTNPAHDEHVSTAPQKEQKVEQAHEEVIDFDDAKIKQAGIALAQAEPKRIASMMQLSGEIRANEDHTAHVVPQLAGFVQSVSGELGQQVKQGQILAVISSPQLSELRSDLLAVQQRKELAQITFDREKKLWADKISSEQDYLQAKQQLSEMAISYNNALQKLSAFGVTPSGTASSKVLNRYELRAPFAGMIVEKHITQGEAIKEDANVFTISDLSTVWAEVVVSAQDLSVIRVGEKATVRAASMQSAAEGKVTFVSSLFGEQTRTAKVRITLKNPQMAWRPGLFVTVDITSSETDVRVAVPVEAIQTVENQPTVFVKVADGFIPQTVELGRSDGLFTEISNGLTAGAVVAAANSFMVKAEQGKNSASHAH